LSDTSLKRAMLQFCAGGASGFSVDELERIADAARGTRQAKENADKTREAEADAEEAQRHMGKGWTHVRLVLNKRDEDTTLWEYPVTVALFAPPRGYLLHVFEGPTEHGTAQALCGELRSATLEHVRDTFVAVTAPVRRLGRGRYGFGLNFCEACVRSRAPYTLRWLPPQPKPVDDFLARQAAAADPDCDICDGVGLVGDDGTACACVRMRSSS